VRVSVYVLAFVYVCVCARIRVCVFCCMRVCPRQRIYVNVRYKATGTCAVEYVTAPHWEAAMLGLKVGMGTCGAGRRNQRERKREGKGGGGGRGREREVRGQRRLYGARETERGTGWAEVGCAEKNLID
jgi:hypothetical protein